MNCFKCKYFVEYNLKDRFLKGMCSYQPVIPFWMDTPELRNQMGQGDNLLQVISDTCAAFDSKERRMTEPPIRLKRSVVKAIEACCDQAQAAFEELVGQGLVDPDVKVVREFLEAVVIEED